MADTHIKFNDHSISSAFKDHYIVPDYQREYVWKDEQIEQLTSNLEPVHIKIASKIIAKVRFPKYRTSSLS